MRFSDDFLEELRNRNDIESVISPYVALKSKGNTMVGLCPFHNEKTPSFTVYLDTQSYYCFGCSNGGDCVTFIKNIENLDYGEAVRYLADKSNMQLPLDSGDDTASKVRRQIYEANRAAAHFYYNSLISENGKIAQEYIKKRALSDEICRSFGIGYAPDSWDSLVKHLKSKGYSEDLLITACLARRSKNGGCIDLFRNRLMFPVIDLRGNVIAFTGRVFDNSTPKYMNTPETAVYKKSNVLYALNTAKNSGGRKLILCEGNMDVIALHQAGFTNAVAAMGTAFTQNHAKLLSTYADEVLICYDNDEAGHKAADKVISILSNTTLKVRVINLSGGKDPDEIIKNFGAEKMKSILDGALSDTAFRISQAASGIDLQASDGKVSFIKAVIPVLASIHNSVERDIYISEISSKNNIAKEAIFVEIEKHLKKQKKRESREIFTVVQKQLIGHPNITSDEKAFNKKTKTSEEKLITAILNNPDFVKRLKDFLNAEIFFSDTHKRIFSLLCEKINNDRSFELQSFSEELSGSEMSVLTRLYNEKNNFSFTLRECMDYIDTLKDEKKKQTRQMADEIPDEDFKDLAKLLNKK